MPSKKHPFPPIPVPAIPPLFFLSYTQQNKNRKRKEREKKAENITKVFAAWGYSFMEDWLDCTHRHTRARADRQTSSFLPPPFIYLSIIYATTLLKRLPDMPLPSLLHWKSFSCHPPTREEGWKRREKKEKKNSPCLGFATRTYSPMNGWEPNLAGLSSINQAKMTFIHER